MQENDSNIEETNSTDPNNFGCIRIGRRGRGRGRGRRRRRAASPSNNISESNSDNDTDSMAAQPDSFRGSRGVYGEPVVRSRGGYGDEPVVTSRGGYGGSRRAFCGARGVSHRLYHNSASLADIAIQEFDVLQYESQIMTSNHLNSFDNVVIHSPDKNYFGVLKWSGSVDGRACAGIELEDACSFGSNGIFNEIKLFSADHGKGVLVPIHLVTIDQKYKNTSESLKGLAILKFKNMKLDDSFLEEKNLVLNEGVEITLQGNTKCSGILKWVGILDFNVCAGIELDERVSIGSNGSCGGIKIFHSKRGRGVFIPLQNVEYDSSRLHPRDECLNDDNVNLSLPDCSVCMDVEVGIFLMPCGHICVCHTCAQRLNKCPICQKPISGKEKIYFP